VVFKFGDRCAFSLSDGCIQSLGKLPLQRPDLCLQSCNFFNGSKIHHFSLWVAKHGASFWRKSHPREARLNPLRQAGTSTY
jgi:hypothetical protein